MTKSCPDDLIASLRSIAVEPDKLLIASQAKTNLHRIMEQTITPRQHRVLVLRFGLNGNEKKTLEEVGYLFGVNKERIRQIEVKAMRRMKRSSSRYMLLSMLDDFNYTELGRG